MKAVKLSESLLNDLGGKGLTSVVTVDIVVTRRYSESVMVLAEDRTSGLSARQFIEIFDT